MLTQSQMDKITRAYRSLAAQPGFRPRRTQRRMILDVAAVLAQPPGACDADPPVPDPVPLLVEAPTGTGKSLAYLAAAVPLALEEGQQIVISTGTVALQEQLVFRDIPRFLATTGMDATVAVAKGRARYLCPQALEATLRSVSQDDLFGGQSAVDMEASAGGHDVQLSDEDRTRLTELAQAFARGHWSGDLDSLEPPLPGQLRPQLTITPAACAGNACAYSHRCPLLKARQESRSATIVVSNHDLLLSDLMQSESRTSFLPPPENTLFILDEGHHLELKARERASVEVGVDTLNRLVDWSARLAGHLPTLASIQPTDRATWSRRWEKVIDIARIGVEAFVTAIAAAVAGARPSMGSRGGAAVHAASQSPVIRFPFGAVSEPMREAAQILLAAIEPLALTSAELARKMRKREAEVEHRTTQLAGRVSEGAARVLELAKSWVDAPQDGEVVKPAEVVARWISRDDNGNVRAHACQASGARLLERLLWSRGRRVVVTSATLSEGGDFRRVASQLGLYFRPHRTSVLDSPFDLASQAELIVPAMTHQPTNVTGHTQEVIDWLASSLDQCTLATLVLFTSRSQMMQVFKALPVALRKDTQCQGDRSKNALLERHAERAGAGRRSVVFGLASFAEGIDLPGDLCRQVVIVKLPFAVPDDPIEATLTEAIEAAGGNAFAERVIPEAIRKLVQACGRLIRTETDQGRIVILDRRLIDKPYGRRMLQALPPFRRTLEGA